MPDASFSDSDRIAALEIDESAAPPTSIDLEQERRVAVFDLLEGNHFRLRDESGAPQSGPYALTLGAAPDGWRIRAKTGDGAEAAPLHLPSAALTPLLQDYLAVCDSYRDAIKHLAPSEIEAIDQERRALHSEASEALRDGLSSRAELDGETARRLFTVFCALKADALGAV